MSEKPDVLPGDWIKIGDQNGLDAVVCQVYNDQVKDADMKIVYLDRRNQAIAEDVKWEKNEWKFVNQGPCGIYADNAKSLERYVSILRKGKFGL